MGNHCGPGDIVREAGKNRTYHPLEESGALQKLEVGKGQIGRKTGDQVRTTFKHPNQGIIFKERKGELRPWA